jgi:hypothetical protein
MFFIVYLIFYFCMSYGFCASEDRAEEEMFSQPLVSIKPRPVRGVEPMEVEGAAAFYSDEEDVELLQAFSRLPIASPPRPIVKLRPARPAVQYPALEEAAEKKVASVLAAAGILKERPNALDILPLVRPLSPRAVKRSPSEVENAMPLEKKHKRGEGF